MKRDKLYTVNKWNRHPFARKFAEGGPVQPFNVLDFQGLSFSGPPLKGLTPTSSAKASLGKKIMGTVGSLGSALGGVAGNLIRGDFDDGGVGSGIQNVGGAIGAAIPGPVGGIISGASGVVGGLFSRMFGVSENKENTNAIKTNTQNAYDTGNTLAASATTTDLVANAGNMAGSSGFSWEDLYRNGWFTSKGTRLGNNLIAKERTALGTQAHGLSTGAFNTDYNIDSNIMRNFAAFGGPLNKRYSEGGEINIKHPGRLTALKKRTGKTEAELYSDGNPDHKKMVVFARNSRKWKKALGGYLDARKNLFDAGGFMEGLGFYGTDTPNAFYNSNGVYASMGSPTYNDQLSLLADSFASAYKGASKRDQRAMRKASGLNKKDFGALMLGDTSPLFAFGGDMETNSADYPTGLTHIDEGGLHEENPNGGVQIGTDNEGIPNLVEEGEAIYNDYVFSDRISLDDDTKTKFHISKKRDMTYAQLAKKLEEEIAERPNDPISRAGFKAQMQTLEEEQERQKQEMEAQRAEEAFKALPPEEKVEVMQQAAQQEQQEAKAALQQEAMAEQAAQQQIPQEEMPMEQPPVEPVPALEEQPEAELNVHSTGGPLDTELKEVTVTADRITKPTPTPTPTPTSAPAPAAPLTLGEVTDVLNLFNTLDSEEKKQKALDAIASSMKDVTGRKRTKIHYFKQGGDTDKKKFSLGLRDIGLLGPVNSLLMMASGVGKPDYSGLDEAVGIASAPASMASYTPSGTYIRYTPMDIWQGLNNTNTSARATDRAILNSGSPSSMAGLIASGYNNQLSGSDLYRKALEYNDAKRVQIADFNRGTEQFNSQLGSQVSQFNAQASNQNRQHLATMAMQAAKEKMDAEAGWYNSLYGNINSFYKGFGDLGKEKAITDIFQRLEKRGALPEGTKDALPDSNAEGGKIKRKKNKRRGLTY